VQKKIQQCDLEIEQKLNQIINNDVKKNNIT